MRHLLLAPLAIVLSLPLSASAQILNVTPQTLDGWKVSGGDKNALSSQTQLTLPAGAQLSRDFPKSAVIVHLVTQPAFSEDATEWPIIGVGPVALTIIRKDGQGQLMLVIDETTVKELPWSVPLDKQGSTADLVLAYDPQSGTGLVSYQERMQVFDAPASTRPSEVWLSAGDKSPWPLVSMEVVLLSNNSQSTGQYGDSGSASAKQNSAAKLLTAVDGLLGKAGAGGVPVATTIDTAKTPSVNTISTLEVFTPPSVHRVRIVGAIRATLERNQSNEGGRSP